MGRDREGRRAKAGEKDMKRERSEGRKEGGMGGNEGACGRAYRGGFRNVQLGADDCKELPGVLVWSMWKDNNRAFSSKEVPCDAALRSSGAGQENRSPPVGKAASPAAAFLPAQERTKGFRSHRHHVVEGHINAAHWCEPL
jgi:hypothetical protein